MKHEIYERPQAGIPIGKNDWARTTNEIEKRYGLPQLQGVSDKQINYARVCRAACFVHLEATFHTLNDYEKDTIEWAEAALDKIIDHARTEMDARTWIDRGARYAYNSNSQPFFIEDLLTNFEAVENGKMKINQVWPK